MVEARAIKDDQDEVVGYSVVVDNHGSVFLYIDLVNSKVLDSKIEKFPVMPDGEWMLIKARSRIFNGLLVKYLWKVRHELKMDHTYQKSILRAKLPIKIETVVETVIPPEEVVVNRYAETPIFYRRISGGKMVVLALFDVEAGVKKSTVYHINKDGVATEEKSSKAQKHTEDQLAQKGWKMAKLGDDGFESILLAMEQAN